MHFSSALPLIRQPVDDSPPAKANDDCDEPHCRVISKLREEKAQNRDPSKSCAPKGHQPRQSFPERLVRNWAVLFHLPFLLRNRYSIESLLSIWVRGYEIL